MPLSFVRSFRSRDGPIDRRLIVVFWGAHLSYLVNAITTTDGRIVTSALLFLLAGALSGVQARVSREGRKPGSLGQVVRSQRT
jgi:hypothetical protein